MKRSWKWGDDVRSFGVVATVLTSCEDDLRQDATVGMEKAPRIQEALARLNSHLSDTYKVSTPLQ